MRKKLLHLPPFISTLILVVVCAMFSGCYSLSQGITMLGYLNRAIPLEKVDDAEFVRLTADIRAFAMDELGLSQSKNYTSYVEIDRDYLAAIVSASAKDSFKRHEWNYPVVGRMPYKGFFNIDGARKERSKLEKKGLDVWIRGVDAFSTLGWFKDPLYSYMKKYSPDRLADLIIHELVHSTVFIKGQINFNEELAEFIGSEGARLYMEKRYGLESDEYKTMLMSKENNKKYVAFINELIAELDILYSNNAINSEEKLIQKEQIIIAAKKRFEAEYDTRFTSENYKSFIELAVNNAYLELYRLYYTEDNFYQDLFERSGSDLPAFIAAAKKLKKKNGNLRNQLEVLLAELSSEDTLLTASPSEAALSAIEK